MSCNRHGYSPECLKTRRESRREAGAWSEIELGIKSSKEKAKIEEAREHILISMLTNKRKRIEAEESKDFIERFRLAEVIKESSNLPNSVISLRLILENRTGRDVDRRCCGNH